MIEPSPWEALTSNLVTAILAIGIKHHSLHSQVYNCLAQYLNNCRSATRAASTANVQYEGSGNTRNQKPIKTIVLFLSILGFLEATSGNAYFYNTRERLDLVKLLRDLLSGTFMIVVEGALSSIRTSETFSRPLKDFKFFFRRYASSGRPLGAMLLHQGFLRVLVSCCALELTTPEILQQKSVLDFLMSARTSDLTARRKGTHEIIEVATELAADAMRLLEDGADYLQIGSIWQQHQAFKVKGYAITAFVCCMVIDEEIADADLLMAWLDDAMADTVQLADDGLACVMLKSLSVAAKVSPAMAPTLSRSLPRFIVRGGLQGSAVVVAAKCLASILQSLSQDTVITVLYSLGNVLSSSSAEKGIGGSSYANGSMGTRSSTKYTQHATGSAISLNMSGEEETAAAYVNIVRAIVTIATTCADEKITPLALSMLIQKLGRINSIVDLHIISETADLGVIGGEAELKSLLKMYDRLSHQAVMENNDLLLEAVRAGSRDSGNTY